MKATNTELVKKSIYEVLQDTLFESVDILQSTLQEYLDKNLTFKTQVAPVNLTNGFTHSYVTYNEDNTSKVINFTVYPNATFDIKSL